MQKRVAGADFDFVSFEGEGGDAFDAVDGLLAGVVAVGDGDFGSGGGANSSRMIQGWVFGVIRCNDNLRANTTGAGGKCSIRKMDARTNDYALVVEKEFEKTGYRIMVSPVGRIMRMVSIRCCDWEETVRTLATHAHYTEQSIQECDEAIKNGVGHQVDRIVLTDEEAEALGWLPEYNKPEAESSV